MNNSIKFVFLSFLAALLILGCKSTPGQQSFETATKPTYKYNVTDEALIDASLEKVYSAIVDEADGKTNWWQPALSSKIRKGKCYAEVGTICDVTVGGPPSITFAAETAEVKENEFIRVNYIEGPFRGEGLWEFENLDGKTKVSFHWQTNPSGLLIRVSDIFMNIEKKHSEVMQSGFDELKKALEDNASNY